MKKGNNDGKTFSFQILNAKLTASNIDLESVNISKVISDKILKMKIFFIYFFINNPPFL